MLFYSGAYSYTDVVAREWQMRSTRCYIGSIVQSTENAFAAITLL